MNTRNLGIELDQNADFSAVIQIFGDAGPIDITGYSFKSEMRASTDPAAPTVAEFDFTILDQVASKGQVQWSLPLSETTGIIASISNPLQTQRLTTPFVYDVLMKDTSGATHRIIQGIIYFSPTATEGSL